MAKNKRNNNKLKKKYMIIGTFNLDGTSPEPVDISTKGRFFEVEACIVRHPRRYPTYKVDYCSLAFCETFEAAEIVMKDIIASGQIDIKDLYCLYIYERVFDVAYDRNEYSKCWLYNEQGEMIDKRLFPSYWSEAGFVGRSEDEIRFKWGDLAEWYDGDRAHLVFILAPPRDKDWYAKKAEEDGQLYCGDISDDSYVTIDGPTYFPYHSHVDALHLFKPRFPIPKNIMKKYEKIWEGYLKDRDDYNRENHCNSPF